MAIGDNGAAMGGIGAGLLSFTDTYLKTKQMNQANDLNQRYADMAAQKENAGLLEKGMVASPSGEVSFDDIHQKLHDQEAQNYLDESAFKAEKLKPGSALKSPLGGLYKSVMNQYQPGAVAPDGTQQPGLGDQMVNENTRLADLDDMKPAVSNMFAGFNADKRTEAVIKGMDARERIASEKNESQEKQKQMSIDAAQQKSDQAQKQKDSALEEKYQKDKIANLHAVHPMNATIRTGAGTAQVQLQNIDRLQGALAAAKGNPSEVQSTEIALGLQRILSGGTPNGEMASHLIPKSLQGDTEKLSAYIFNNPQKLNQQGFFKQSQDLANREQKIVRDQLKQWQYPQLYALETTIKRHEEGPNGTPGEWNEALKMNGVDPADYARFRQSGEINAPEPVIPKARARPSGPKGPPVGTVKDGYKFKGGDPKNPNNWEQQGLMDRARGLLGF